MSVSPVGVPVPLPPVAPVGATSATPGTGFADALSSVVDRLSSVQGNADSLAQQVATGTLQNPHDYLIAATEASLTTQMTVAVRNKALEAFNEIMRMPL
jgi:flagellar hook-basal body complex protein FliE